MRTLIIGLILGICSAVLVGLFGSWMVAMKIVGGVGIGSWLLAGVFSGAFISGDRTRANQHIESSEDRKLRNKYSSILFLFGLPFLIIALIIFLLSGTQNTKSIDLSIIDNQLDTIVYNQEVFSSSSPIDYIQANQELYDDILNTGSPGFNYMLEELKDSQDNGLREWIIAKACNDILKDKAPDVQWDSGKDWLNKYEATQGKK